jgi:hypothetical protein
LLDLAARLLRPPRTASSGGRWWCKIANWRSRKLLGYFDFVFHHPILSSIFCRCMQDVVTIEEKLAKKAETKKEEALRLAKELKQRKARFSAVFDSLLSCLRNSPFMAFPWCRCK